MPSYPQWVLDNIKFFLRHVLKREYPNTKIQNFETTFTKEGFPIFSLDIINNDILPPLVSCNVALDGQRHEYIELENRSSEQIRPNQLKISLSIRGNINFELLNKKASEFACEYLNDPNKLNCISDPGMQRWFLKYLSDEEGGIPYLCIEQEPKPAYEETREIKLQRMQRVVDAYKVIWKKLTNKSYSDDDNPCHNNYLGGNLRKELGSDRKFKLIYEQFSLSNLHRANLVLHPQLPNNNDSQNTATQQPPRVSLRLELSDSEDEKDDEKNDDLNSPRPSLKKMKAEQQKTHFTPVKKVTFQQDLPTKEALPAAKPKPPASMKPSESTKIHAAPAKPTQIIKPLSKRDLAEIDEVIAEYRKRKRAAAEAESAAPLGQSSHASTLFKATAKPAPAVTTRLSSVTQDKNGPRV